MSRPEAQHDSAGNGHSPSLGDQVGETLLGEIGFGPKAFYSESDQYLRDPNFLSHHPELYFMPAAALSTPLQLGWKAVDDSGHLVFDSLNDELTAGLDIGKAAIVDPLMGGWDGVKGVGALLTGHPGEFVKDEFSGLKELTVDPLWDTLKGAYSAVKPIGSVLSHPLQAGLDVLETGGRVLKDAASLPISGIEGNLDIGIKAPFDLITGHPGKAASDVVNGIKHETVDIVKDGYKGVSDTLNGAAHAVFDFL
jgi:hypothetical protein